MPETPFCRLELCTFTGAQGFSEPLPRLFLGTKSSVLDNVALLARRYKSVLATSETTAEEVGGSVAVLFCPVTAVLVRVSSVHFLLTCTLSRSRRTQVIASTLERYGEEGEPSDFELQYVQPPPEKPARSPRSVSSLVKKVRGSPKKIVQRILAPDEIPVLVAEWMMDPAKAPCRYVPVLHLWFPR